MKNKLLLTTAIVFAATSAKALTLEFSPYVSAKGALTWLQNKADINYGFYYENSGSSKDLPGTIIDGKTYQNTTWGLRLASGVATPVKGGQIRSELEFSYISPAKDSKGWVFKMMKAYPGQHVAIETSGFSGMVNFYYDINTCTRFTPYVGVGFGMAHMKAKTKTYGHSSSRDYFIQDSMTDDNPTWNISVGATYALNDKWSLDLGYRYTDYGRITQSKNKRGHLWDSSSAMQEHGLDVKADLKMDSHEVNLGLRYAF